MKYLFGSLALLLMGSYIYGQPQAAVDGVEKSTMVDIIPAPVSVHIHAGHFTLRPDTRVVYNDHQLGEVAGLLTATLNRPTGFHLQAGQSAAKQTNAIVLIRNIKADPTIGSEGYRLTVTTTQVRVIANTDRGVFYGIQSLLQLMPPQIESDHVSRTVSWTITALDILDYPRFEWRGLMVDESRHFFGKKAIEQFVDEMAKYKYNVFHWHLSDDQGWRIEINGLPRLTEVGAWRVPRTGIWGTMGAMAAPQPGEKATDGGFYTQDEIKEVVRYAALRGITIVPEIDVPGHALALIAAYPNLSSTQAPAAVWPQGTPGSIDNVLDVANDSTWLILDKIFTQVAALFPGAYIHVGGDEANRKFWMKNPKDVALMQKKGLTTPAELQSYFEKKLEKLILSKGKKMIGWDEILEGGVAPEATIMSWRGEKGGVEAARLGHQVIMMPAQYVYINRGQGNPIVEPPAPGMITLEKAYKYSFIPTGVDPKFVLGGQACLWTEFIPNYRHLEYMAYPRAMAIAERLWSSAPLSAGAAADQKDWPGFISRVEQHFKRLDAAGIKYASAIYDPVITGEKNAKGDLTIKLSTQIPGLQLYYSFDGTNPDNYYPAYKETDAALTIPKGATVIKVITYRDGHAIGKQINCPLSHFATK